MRPILARIAVLFLMVGPLLLPPAPAFAAEASTATAAQSTLEISVAGSAFAPIATQDLFTAARNLVPGDRISSQFTVRNDSPNRQLLSVALGDSSSSSRIVLDSLSVRAVIPGSTTSPAMALSTAKGCTTLVTSAPIAAGGEMLVTVGLSLAAALTGTAAQNGLASSHLIVGLSDPSGGSTSQTLCEAARHPHPTGGQVTPVTPSGGLPQTGSDILPWLALAMALTAGGATFLVAARRRRGEDGDEDGPIPS